MPAAATGALETRSPVEPPAAQWRAAAGVALKPGASAEGYGSLSSERSGLSGFAAAV